MKADATTPKIRVLVVDDSAAIRRLLRSLLETVDGVTVVGTAANGQAALDQIAELSPDIVTLDVEMPVLDGLGCLRELRKRWPKLPVIMLSTLTERGGAATLDALAAGASDYITKPSKIAGMDLGVESIRALLVSKIKALVERTTAPRSVLGTGASAAPHVPALGIGTLPRVRPAKQVEMLAIGISTGGPNALGMLLPAFPADFRVPIVIAQHIPPLFSGLLAQRLNASSQVTVKEAEDGEPLRPATAYVIPGDFHMTVAGMTGTYRVSLNKQPPENSCRPAVDVLFRSLAQSVGGATLGVIMTGMGQDGLHGCRQLHAAGAQILAQDEASSVVWGMPGFVARAGLADDVLPLERLASAIALRVGGTTATAVAVGKRGAI